MTFDVEKVERKLPIIGRAIERLLPGLGFCLIVFEFKRGPKSASYISNADRSNMIKALKETAERLGRHEDRKPGQNN